MEWKYLVGGVVVGAAIAYWLTRRSSSTS